MLEQKLLVGGFINLTLPPPPVVAPYNPGDFVRVQVQDCYLQESTGVLKKTRAVQGGQGPKAHRNFKWLPWLPGAISVVNLVGSEVLTGPMSGCWLVTFRTPNGVPHAGHLGTDIADPAGTAAVNNAWNAFALANAGSVIGGFNPLRHWNGAMPAMRPGEAAARIFGLYTTANQFYIVVCYQQPPPAPATLLRVAGRQLAPSSTLARLQQVHTPGP